LAENHWATFSGQQLASAYALEADTLGALAQSAVFGDLIQHFRDYDVYLRRINSDPGYRSRRKKIISDKGVVDIAVASKESISLFCQAQIAASAELFKGWEIRDDQLTREGMRLLVEKSAATLIGVPNVPTNIPPEQFTNAQKQILSAVNVLQNADTVRVVQIIKLLGLLPPTAEHIHQLSLGVGNGYRDLYGVHITPKVTINELPNKSYFFDTIERQAAHTVLIDNDAAQQDHFKQLNLREREKVLALNDDASESLEQLHKVQAQSQLKQRNLVVCLRIDHRMIPSPEEFLGLLSRVIAPEADLVMTIGAGHNLSEFEGRLHCFDNLVRLLTNLGHNPVRVILHRGGSLEDKRRTPAFGQLAYTSYQILYCRLKRGRLSEATD
tara:strand:- start:455 stop:1606 length:1152 start_codon:yes stop_codon:yes gene_type:complete